MFSFKYILNDEDYISFNKYHLLNSSTGKRNLMSFRFIIPFFCFLIIIIFYVTSYDNPILIISEAVLMAIFSVLWIVLSKKFMLYSIKRHVKKLKSDGRLPYGGNGELIFNDESIHDISAKTESKISYTLIEKIGVTQEAIYIYFSSIQAFILPTSVFAGDDEKQKFLDYLYSKINV